MADKLGAVSSLVQTVRDLVAEVQRTTKEQIREGSLAAFVLKTSVRGNRNDGRFQSFSPDLRFMPFIEPERKIVQIQNVVFGKLSVRTHTESISCSGMEIRFTTTGGLTSSYVVRVADADNVFLLQGALKQVFHNLLSRTVERMEGECEYDTELKVAYVCEDIRVEICGL